MINLFWGENSSGRGLKLCVGQYA